LKPVVGVGRAGHLLYGLYQDGERQCVYEHIAVCLAYHGPKPTPFHEAAHGDGNPQNNSKENLRWARRGTEVARWVSTLTGPHAFLAAISRSECVLINGIEHRPTAKQRRRAAAHLAAALEGRKVREADDTDDFYSPKERGKP
jgi:hypothetical protein